LSEQLTIQDVVSAVKELKKQGWISNEIVGFKKPDDKEKVQFT